MANKDQMNSAEAYREERKARLAQSAKKNQKKSEKHRTLANAAKKIVAIVLIAAIACGLAWVVIDQTGAIKKLNTVASYGDIKISELEFTYYYTRQLSNLYSYADYYAQYGMDMGIDSSVSPDEQNYGTDEDGKEITLAEYLKNATIEALQEYMILYHEALDAGYKLTEEEETAINDDVEALREEAATNNFSLNAYLKASLGKGVNEKFYREQLKMEKIVSRYQTDRNETITNSYSEADVEAIYNKDKDNYDAVDMRMYTFSVAALTAKDGESEEELAKRQEAANNKLKAEAEALAAASTSEKAFLTQVEKLEADTKSYDADSSTNMAESSKETITSYVSEDAAKWAFDDSRKAGDVKMFTIGEADAVTGYCVVYLTKTQYAPIAVDVRHILLSFLEDPSDTTSTPTDKQIAAAKTSADEIYKQWQAGEKTEDSFAALAKEKSKDSGSAADGGLITGITSTSSYVESFLNWCFTEGRKPGDHGIIESSYGYHIMYCSKTDFAWKDTIRSTKADEDFTKEMTELKESDKYKIEKNDKAIDKAVDSFLKTYKKNLALSNSKA
ncbi:MAG: peptidylprolyl isomerase [Clostridia bacterium]|nr:peptidylprolyl isomerase [Clostridia bacterium]MBQ7046764.1 peptidylprolyl isomerase [Oscillospiraceae bacterium]